MTGKTLCHSEFKIYKIYWPKGRKDKFESKLSHFRKLQRTIHSQLTWYSSSMEKSNTLDIPPIDSSRNSEWGWTSGVAQESSSLLLIVFSCLIFLLNKIHYWQFEKDFTPYGSFSFCVLHIVSQSSNTEHDLQTHSGPTFNTPVPWDCFEVLRELLHQQLSLKEWLKFSLGICRPKLCLFSQVFRNNITSKERGEMKTLMWQHSDCIKAVVPHLGGMWWKPAFPYFDGSDCIPLHCIVNKNATPVSDIHILTSVMYC